MVTEEKVSGRMKHLRDPKRAKSEVSLSPPTAVVLPEPLTSGAPTQPSDTQSQPADATFVPSESEVPLDESLRVPVTTKLSYIVFRAK